MVISIPGLDTLAAACDVTLLSEEGKPLLYSCLKNIFLPSTRDYLGLLLIDRRRIQSKIK